MNAPELNLQPYQTRVWVLLGQIHLNGMIWKGTYVLINDPTADKAYQSNKLVLW